MSATFMGDRSIAEKIRQGDQKTFDFFFNRYYDAIYLFACNITRNKPEGQDIATESFLQLWNIKERFETVEKMKSYLYTVARSLSIKALQKNKKERRVEFEYNYLSREFENFVDNAAIKAEFINHISLEIQKLPQACQTIFVMTFFKNMKIAEIANQLNISVNTVKTQRARAMKQLRYKFSNNELFIFLVICYGISQLSSLALN